MESEKDTEHLKEDWKILKVIAKNPRLIVLAIYWSSAIAALFVCPNGIALSVSLGGGATEGAPVVPTIIYVLVAGIFITAFSLGAGAYRGSDDTGPNHDKGRPSIVRAWFALIIMMIIHFAFISGSIGM